MTRQALGKHALNIPCTPKRASLAAALWAHLVCASHAWAQTATDASQAIELEPVLVTATREVGGTPLSDVPGSVSVIEREEIDQQASISDDLGDVIAKTVPGISPSNEA
ncbi:MAG TPA: hypothetical protein VHJ19_12055 [Gammaproteobacteria bacterium]|nr:hypothetical protein [Gammaproteobacteria bacterium]